LSLLPDFFLPGWCEKYEVAITIDTQTASSRKSKEVAPSFPSFKDLREPHPNHAVRFPTFKRALNRSVKSNIVIALVEYEKQATINQIHSAEGNHAANPKTEIEASTSFSDAARMSDSKGAGSDAEMIQPTHCPICLEEHDSKTIQDLKCGHLFHEACLSGWINSEQKNRLLCPECREELCKKELTTSASETSPTKMNASASKSPITDTNPSFWTRLEELYNRPPTRASPSRTGSQASNGGIGMYRGIIEIIWDYPLWNRRVTVGNVIILFLMMLIMLDMFDEVPVLHNIVEFVTKLFDYTWRCQA
jgi:hypothetical protein